jgi:hypothetical protein
VFGIEQWDIVLSNAVLASLSMWKWHVYQKQQDLYKFQLFWKWKGFEFYNSQWSTIMFINILMHAVFHIWTVIIPRERYGPEGFSPRVDIGLFIAYFNIELQRTKLTSTAYTKLIWVIDIGWVMITVLLWKKSCIDLFIERLDIVLSAFSPMGWYRCGTFGVYVWAKLTLLLINMW